MSPQRSASASTPGHRGEVERAFRLGAFPGQFGRPVDTRRHQHQLCADLVDRRRCSAREPERTMMIIAGGRSIESLYMAPALARLIRFPNVLVGPVWAPANLDRSGEAGPSRPTICRPWCPPMCSTHAARRGWSTSIKSIAALQRRGLLRGSVPADRPMTRSRKAF